MASVTSPFKPRVTLTPAPERQPVSTCASRDGVRPCFGDRIASAIWIVCVLFMASLLAYDAVVGLSR
jgi:hypothetical protein